MNHQNPLKPLLADAALVIVACPLMMFFMMRGMSHDDGPDHNSSDETPRNHEHR